jgi:hypothetical protein
VFIKIEEILLDKKGKGLASAGILRNSSKGGTFFRFAFSMFSELRASVQAKVCAVENCGSATEQCLLVVHGGS